MRGQLACLHLGEAERGSGQSISSLRSMLSLHTPTNIVHFFTFINLGASEEKLLWADIDVAVL